MLELLLLLIVVVVALGARQGRRETQRRLESLDARLARLERQTASAPPSVPAAPVSRISESLPVPSPDIGDRPPNAAQVSLPSPPLAGPAAGQATTPLGATAAPAPGGGSDGSALEQLVGGIWLQNVGSVVLLLGVFLMIVWGYTSGRLGPLALVVAGVGLGLGFAWRGDRLARSVPAFGHALVGIGLGIVYLTLYLGHFQLRALPRLPAFALLTAVSIASVFTGLHYRVQTIAVLGVIGAFVPQLLAAWTPLRGFDLTPAVLLAYLALVDAIVFVLAAAAGWSGLGLAALLMSASTWALSYHGSDWSWPVQIGLALLFAALGLAPIPRLVRTQGPVRAIDLALIAVAPLCFLAASSPFLRDAARLPVAWMAIALAAAHAAFAWWAERRRSERDLWRPLTGAAVLYATLAIERALGDEHTPLAWTIEGVTLVALSARERGGWLRFCGSLVAGMGALWLVVTLATETRPDTPVLDANAVRTLISIAALLFAAHHLASRRAALSRDEHLTPEAWGGVGNLLLMDWISLESLPVARAIAGGDSAASPDRLQTLRASVTSGGWIVVAVALLTIGWLRGSAFLRWCGLLVFGMTLLKFVLVDLQRVDVFWRFLTTIAVGAAMLAISYAYQARARARDAGG